MRMHQVWLAEHEREDTEKQIAAWGVDEAAEKYVTQMCSRNPEYYSTSEREGVRLVVETPEGEQFDRIVFGEPTFIFRSSKVRENNRAQEAGGKPAKHDSNEVTK